MSKPANKMTAEELVGNRKWPAHFTCDPLCAIEGMAYGTREAADRQAAYLATTLCTVCENRRKLAELKRWDDSERGE